MARGLLIAWSSSSFWSAASLRGRSPSTTSSSCLDQDVNEKWAQVQNVYQRRADLMPNLVETVKGFAAQERTVLDGGHEGARERRRIQLTPEALNDPKAHREIPGRAEPALRRAQSRLLVTVERYPELKSNQNFLAAAEPARGHREPDHGGAAALQRVRARVQHPPAVWFPARIVAGFSGYHAQGVTSRRRPTRATPPKVKF